MNDLSLTPDILEAIKKVNEENITPPEMAMPEAPVADPSNTDSGEYNTGVASVFANQQDIERYRAAKASGASEQQALSVGDNGIGFKGDDTTSDIPQIALPPDTPGFAHGRLVEVQGPAGSTVARLTDKMPATQHLKGRANVDLNPAAAKAVGSSGLDPVKWKFVDNGRAPLAGTPIPRGLAGAFVRSQTGKAAGGELGVDDGSGDVVSSGAGGAVADPANIDTGGDTPIQEAPPAPSLAGAKYLGMNPDGSKQLSNGMSVYPNNSIKYKLGEKEFYQANKYSKPVDISHHHAKPTVISEGGKHFDISDPSNPKEIKLPVETSEADKATGEEALADLNEGQKAFVKQMLDYKADPGSLSARKGDRDKLILKAYQVDPSFDIGGYKTRYATRKDFTSGVAARNIRSINTVVNHIDELSNAIPQLNNGSFQLVNKGKNTFREVTGDPNISKFNFAADAVASELASVFKGTGSGTDAEIKAWRNKINNAQSPEQLRAEVDEAVRLMSGRMDALQNNYKEGIGKPVDFNMLSPKSRNILLGMGHKDVVEADGPQPAATPEAAPVAPTATTVRVRRLSDGKTGTMPAGNVDTSKYQVIP